ncbi:hypothetical protein JP74_20885 [Devosia sp. 17-2-E-8]|nr:hypothetical protein JP74_20885 [Devosia sp. 17-2-E-8]
MRWRGDGEWVGACRGSFFLLPLREKVAAEPTDEGSAVVARTPHPPFGHPLPQGERAMGRDRA